MRGLRATDEEREEARIGELVSALRECLPAIPEMAVVLGSGLGGVVESLAGRLCVDGRILPHYPVPSVAGHGASLHFGRLGGRQVLLLGGRVHLYERCDVLTAVRPVRAAIRLGIRRLFLTNTAGSLKRELAPGRIMLSRDCFHLMGSLLEPLAFLRPQSVAGGVPAGNAGGRPIARRSRPTPGEETMRSWRSPEVLSSGSITPALEDAARGLALPLFSGVLAAVPGPSYETAAEIRLLRRLGADAVTMSTIPEYLAAVREGMEVAVVTVITNWATGAGPALSHEEVTRRAAGASRDLARLLEDTARRTGEGEQG